MSSLYLLGRCHFQRVKNQEREIFIQKAINYINQYDGRFTWNVISDIENKAIKKPEERVMERFKSETFSR